MSVKRKEEREKRQYRKGEKVQPSERFELSTPGLLDQCSNP